MSRHIPGFPVPLEFCEDRTPLTLDKHRKHESFQAAEQAIGAIQMPDAVETIDADTAARHASELQEQLANHLKIDIAGIKEISPQAVKDLLKLCENGNGSTIVTRHGEEHIPHDIEALGPPDKKIKLMQRGPEEGPVTTKGLIEATGTAFIFLWLQEALQKEVHGLTSHNERAAQVIAIFQALFKRFNGKSITPWQWMYHQRLNCIRYAADTHENPDKRSLLEPTNGAIPWNQTIIDAICGPGTYEGKIQAVQKVLEELSHFAGIAILVGQTQELNISGAEGRKPNLHMRHRNTETDNWTELQHGIHAAP